ncbi:hypothetical protein D3C84_1134500 [compost metagenome]
MTSVHTTDGSAACPWSVVGRERSVLTGSNGSRLCENAYTALKSALLRKICRRLVNQQA